MFCVLAMGAVPVEAKHGGPGVRVLIVEDQPDIAALLSALVGRMGHETVVAPAGKDALRACLGTRPDLVLMDIELPDIDGYELTKRLKSQYDLGTVPVWMVSSLSDNKNKRDAAGMTGYLEKPVSASGLGARWTPLHHLFNSLSDGVVALHARRRLPALSSR